MNEVRRRSSGGLAHILSKLPASGTDEDAHRSARTGFEDGLCGFRGIFGAWSQHLSLSASVRSPRPTRPTVDSLGAESPPTPWASCSRRDSSSHAEVAQRVEQMPVPMWPACTTVAVRAARGSQSGAGPRLIP